MGFVLISQQKHLNTLLSSKNKLLLIKLMEQDEQEVYDGAQTYEQQDPEFIRLQIDVERDLDRFTQEVLRGLVEVTDEKTGERKWVPVAPGQAPPMNELGVRGILVLMKGAVTKISKLSCKTDEEIKKDMFYFHMTLVNSLYLNSDKWNIGLSDVEALKESAIRLVWDVAASSRDGFTAINLRSQYSMSEVSHQDNKPKSRGSFMGIPLGRGK